MTHQKSTDELLGKNQTTAINFAKEFQVKMDYLKAELKAYKRKEDQWLPRFHVRQKGIQMANVDKSYQKGLTCPLILISRRFSGRLI